MHEAQFAVVQNDLADALTKFIALLQKLVDFFNGLKPKTQAVGPCEQALIDAAKAEAVGLLQRIPGYVTDYLKCRFSQPTTQAFSLGQILALVQLLMKYLPQILELLNQLGGLVPSAPGTPPTPGPSGYSPSPVNRCN